MRAELKRGDIVPHRGRRGRGDTGANCCARSISSQAQKPTPCVYCIAALPKTNLARNATSESHERTLSGSCRMMRELLRRLRLQPVAEKRTFLGWGHFVDRGRH